MSAVLAANLAKSGQFSDLKRRILFVIFVLVVFRLGSFITAPGIDPVAMVQFFDQQRGTILALFNMFSGGALERFSIFALGVTPYISASIIVQLMSAVIPRLKELKKEGEQGRRMIVRYTRYGTLLLATFQGFGVGIALQSQEIAYITGPSFIMTVAIVLVTGTMVLMWLGEQINERGIGNGISLIIFAGIVAGLPGAVGGTLELASTGELSSPIVLLVLAIALMVTGLVVFIEKGQRRLIINYARQRGNRPIGKMASSHLPLKLNMAGVIPPIFASSIILFPATVGQWFGGSTNLTWLGTLSNSLSPGQPLYILFYASAIIFFCFFYTAIVFDARETADNLKKGGALIPGIRPGEKTACHIDGILSKLTVVGAVYITLVCLLPEFLILSWNVPFYFGGTSLLIIVVVTMDFIMQIQNRLLTQRYEGLVKRKKGRRSSGNFA